jgi:hypothetical protein
MHLEGDGVVILAGVNLARNAAVGAVGADDHVHLELLWRADLRPASNVA